MIYTIEVTVEVSAHNLSTAYEYIRSAIKGAKKAEVTFIDAEDIAQREEEDE